MYNKILIKSCCTFVSVAGHVATEFKWYYGLIRNPRVSFRGRTDSESIRVDETFVEIHAEDDNDNDNDNDNANDTNDCEYQPFSLNRPGTDTDTNTNMDLLMDNNWASQGFDHLARRPFSQQPRPTNREQNRGSCFF